VSWSEACWLFSAQQEREKESESGGGGGGGGSSPGYWTEMFSCLRPWILQGTPLGNILYVGYI